ncbi:MAG: hypothetical protein VW518_10630, partial [Burkholderiaceae bacterium]
LAELLQQGKVPIPKGMVVHSENRQTVGAILGFPCVLKLPDSSFSQGVIKVRDEAELKVHLQKMFAQSELVLAQEYMPTDFDWRIGVLDGKPLFACKYFMARGHWLILMDRAGSSRPLLWRMLQTMWSGPRSRLLA